MGLPVKDQINYRVERYYFATSGVNLIAGQPLCFQENAATASTTGSPSTTFTAATKGFPFDVEIPNTDNQEFFAGIVHPSSVGAVGPQYIDVIVPQRGDILQVLVSAGSSLGLGDYLKLNYNVPTVTSTNGDGCFDLAALAADPTTSSAVGSTQANALIAALRAGCKVMQAIGTGSTTAGARLAAALWVKFI